MYDAHTNLPACGAASTNLPARSLAFTNLPAHSLTPQNFLPVVQHTWSTSYELPRSQHLLSVSMEHTNLLARIPTRE